MWTKISTKEQRDALTQDYLARRDRLRQRFVDEKLGEADLLYDATKFFKPISTATTEAQAATSKELQKVTGALENLPAQIAAEANFNPLAALFGDATPAIEASPIPQTLRIDPDKGLDVDTIRNHGFIPPSELDLTDTAAIKEIIEGVKKYNRYTLGHEKKTAKKEDKQKFTADIKVLAAYRERLRLFIEGHKLAKKGKGFAVPLQLKGNKFGDLLIDPLALSTGALRAFKGGNLVFEAPADESLFSLLTKRFVKTKQYAPQAIETFKKLIQLSGLPVHGRRNKKSKLVQGSGTSVQYYNNPDALVERLQLLLASRTAGNTGVDNEISAILDELLRSGAISKELALQLNRSLLTV